MKKIETKYLFAEFNGNFFHITEKHKHIAEIDQELSKFGQIHFHLFQVFCQLQEVSVNNFRDKKVMFLAIKLFKDFYEKEHFIKILDKNLSLKMC